MRIVKLLLVLAFSVGCWVLRVAKEIRDRKGLRDLRETRGLWDLRGMVLIPGR